MQHVVQNSECRQSNVRLTPNQQCETRLRAQRSLTRKRRNERREFVRLRVSASVRQRLPRTTHVSFLRRARRILAERNRQNDEAQNDQARRSVCLRDSSIILCFIILSFRFWLRWVAGVPRWVITVSFCLTRELRSPALRCPSQRAVGAEGTTGASPVSWRGRSFRRHLRHESPRHGLPDLRRLLQTGRSFLATA